MNPTRALDYLETGEIPARNFLCVHYDVCLKKAIKHNWPSFTCTACYDYERLDWNPELWKADATRAAALVTGDVDLVLDPPVQDVPCTTRPSII